MNTQLEALRLAGVLDNYGYKDTDDAAAELRRLHALNAELLWALVKIKESTVDGGRVNTLAREAIAKTEAA